MERARMVEAMMREHLSREQMHLLRDALESVFAQGERATQTNEQYIRMFLDAKRVENLSKRTIRYYEQTLHACIGYIDRPIRLIDANDIRRCLAWALNERKVSPATANNERRVLSTFFQWLENEDLIRKSPVKRTKSIREERRDKKPFTDEDVTRMRESLRDVREKAIFELLLSSGMRVSELCGLDRDVMDMHERECEVLGKGSKRRMCYFSAAAKLYLEQYLETRADSNPALFVSKARPHNRLTTSAIEGMMRDLGKRAGVANVHPHRFRRTFATNKLRRGMKLEEIQQLLGHTNIDTTLIYAKLDYELLKVNARRLS
jgi:site-specific recombinase XerD